MSEAGGSDCPSAGSSSEDPRAALEQMMATRQATLNSLFLSDDIPSELEIEMRDELFQELSELFRVSQNPCFLDGAIDQLETIIRRLPTSSRELPGYLEALSSLRISEFEITRAAVALDQAVELSLQAQNVAVTLGFPENNKDVYLKILNGLGCSQSARANHLHHPQDLDDAIATARELINAAPKNSKYYTMGLSNLTSRLRVRYSKYGNQADYDEALRLLNQLTLESPPESVAHAAGLLQLTTMAYAKFADARSLDDLNDAIDYGEAALATLLRNGIAENVPLLITTLCGMYGDRYDMKGDLADVRKAIFFGEKRVRLAGPMHPATGEALWRYLICAQALVNKVNDIDEVEAVVQTAGDLMAAMPEGDYNQRDVNQWLYGDLLTRRYILTEKLNHLLAVVENARKMCENENEKVAKGSPEVAVEKIMWLEEYLEKLVRAPADNKIRMAASQKLPGYFKIACDAHGNQNAPMMLWNQQKHMIMVYSDAIEDGDEIDEDDLESRVREQEAKATRTEDIEKSEEVAKSSEAWTVPEYHTEFGLRNLSIDPNNDKIIFEMPDVVREVFGYADLTPLSMGEFIKREIQLEHDTRKLEEEQGRCPNPRLCRICRKLKVLVPRSDGGWKWNSKINYIPYGNHGQLLMRQYCAVCGLIFAFISHEKRLHPRLAVIDPEVQGTAVEGSTLENGVEILRVSYGLKEVSTLSILDSSDPSQVQELPLDRLKQSLAECDNSHGRQCNRQALKARLSPPISMRQIDVVDESLVWTTSEVKYFALSYVWGSVPMSQTLNSNLASRLLKGGLQSTLSDPLPRTISDAMRFVKSLGERYLWVDALCIVQDDKITKQKNIQQMDKVYSRAFATIVVLSGSDANAGLPGVRPGTRTPLAPEMLSISDRSGDLALDTSSPLIEEVYISASPSPLSMTLDSSVWNTRGWTFQERLLSSRCIYISGDAVHFHCRKNTLLCETGTPEPRTAPGLSALDNPLHELDRLDGRLVNNLPGTTVDDAASRIVFSTYAGLVRGYTARKLTFPGDVLSAFAGVISAIREHMARGEVCGLPGAFLDLALLWNPVRKLERREDVVFGGDATAPDGNGVCPSWSWAGFVGPVEYRLFGKEEEKRNLPASLVAHGFYMSDNGKILTVAGRGSDIGNQSNGSVVSVEDASPDGNCTIQYLGPNILQFEAPVVPASAFPTGGDPEYLCIQGEVHSTGQQMVYRLYDQDKKHCGLYYESMVPAHETYEIMSLSLVGLVEHGETTVPYKGPNRVEGDIPLFDQSVYRASGPGGGVVDTLAVVWGEDGIAKRISVARIHVEAWKAAEPEVKRIALG